MICNLGVKIVIIFILHMTKSENVYIRSTALMSGKVQYTHSVASSIERSLIRCSITCHKNDKCMTLFYQSSTGKCILHSKTFKYKDPDLNENGWKMYLYKNAYSRCPESLGFLHHRHLDLCYNFNPSSNIDYEGNIKTTCESYGGELLRIDSQERQNYIEHVLVRRPYTRVAIQGNSINPTRTWVFDDGTPLSYFNWPQTPLEGDYYLQMFHYNQWTEQDPYKSTTMHMFLCEIR